jgi:FtsP/CotA-like multicopper oxidase with cupredoxin domain
MPPVWRLRAGDILTVTLHNQLAEETNLHFPLTPKRELGMCPEWHSKIPLMRNGC